MNNRRKLVIALGAGTLTAPFCSFAQQKGKVWRIGILLAGVREDNYKSSVSPFISGLAELGYVEGRKQIIGLVSALRKPAVYFITTFVEDGGLIAYAVSFPELARRSAIYADKILRGAKPGDLPIEQPTKIELSINMKTAKALGIKIPNTILVRADRVIE